MFKINYNEIAREYARYLDPVPECSFCRCYEICCTFDDYYVIDNDYQKVEVYDDDNNVIIDYSTNLPENVDDFIRNTAKENGNELDCSSCPAFEECAAFDDSKCDSEDLEWRREELEAYEREKNYNPECDEWEVYPL